MVVIIPITWIEERGAGMKCLSTNKIGVWVRETLVKMIIEPRHETCSQIIAAIISMKVRRRAPVEIIVDSGKMIGGPSL